MSPVNGLLQSRDLFKQPQLCYIYIIIIIIIFYLLVGQASFNIITFSTAKAPLLAEHGLRLCNDLNIEKVKNYIFILLLLYFV